MNPREQFAATATSLLDSRDDVAVLIAEISAQFFTEAARRHPDRFVNVGIREQLLVSAGAGMALAGMRPIIHTFGSFLVERAFEQIKLDLAHQGVGAVLVGTAGSFDIASGGRTHQSPGDVALLDTLPDVTVHAPSTTTEVDDALRAAVAGDGVHYVRVVDQQNTRSSPVGPTLHRITTGSRGVVLALGPVLDDVLAASAGLDLTVLYSPTVRPFDATGLHAALTGEANVAVVEPWLEGTSAHVVSHALRDRPHRLLSMGVTDPDLHRYGCARDHITAHGLDAAGIRARLADWLGQPSI